MAEKATRIADGATGNRIATRDAFEVDAEANPRTIELVDFASRKFASPVGNAVRGNSTLISGADSLDLTAPPAELTTNLLTVGDKSVLCVAAEQSVSGGTVTVTPILFDNEATPHVVGVLPSMVFTQPYAFRRGSGSGNYVLPVQMRDAAGAHRIGLHVTALTGTSNGARVYGWLL